jgi:hypothetical protein
MVSHLNAQRVGALAFAGFLVLGSSAARASAAELPQLNFRPSCEAAAAAARAGDSERFDQCRRQEIAARDQLQKDWNGFDSADRASCRSLALMGYHATYTELLTCLEMARDARNLPDEKLPPTTTGSGGPRP